MVCILLSLVYEQGSHLTLDDYPGVSEALWDARHKWFSIGARFGIGIPSLEAIDKEGDVELKFQKMVIIWLKAGNDCNWKKVCEALSHPTVGMQHMAKKLNTSQKDEPETSEGTFSLYTYHTCVNKN